jgi:hypothetical protein
VSGPCQTQAAGTSAAFFVHEYRLLRVGAAVATADADADSATLRQVWFVRKPLPEKAKVGTRGLASGEDRFAPVDNIATAMASTRDAMIPACRGNGTDIFTRRMAHGFTRQEQANRL